MMLREVRAVRVVHLVSVCNCLREVIAGGARLVRDVIAQVPENIAGGKCGFAGTRSLYTTYIPGRSLLGRRAPVMDASAGA